jgi:hypothetical protein
METLVKMRALLLGFAATTALLGEVDAREMIRRAVAADERNSTFLVSAASIRTKVFARPDA